MPKVFLDCDIIIDVLARRGEYYTPAATLLSLAERKKLEAFTSPLAIANVHYVLSRFSNKNKSRESIRKLRSFISIVPVDEKVIDLALNSTFLDLEDAIQYYAAYQAGIEFLITRNVVDYKSAEISVCTADQYLRILLTQQESTEDTV